jgi:hypothetical protein
MVFGRDVIGSNINININININKDILYCCIYLVVWYLAEMLLGPILILILIKIYYNCHLRRGIKLLSIVKQTRYLSTRTGQFFLNIKKYLGIVIINVIFKKN